MNRFVVVLSLVFVVLIVAVSVAILLFSLPIWAGFLLGGAAGLIASAIANVDRDLRSRRGVRR